MHVAISKAGETLMLATPARTTVESPADVDFDLDFAAIGDGQLALVGGKAGNLGIMTRAGLPVPPGVCVTTHAYREVAANAGLDDLFDRLDRTAATDVAGLAEL